MKTLLTALLLFSFSIHTATAEDNGDVTDVREIDCLASDGPYKLIWEPHLAKWSDKHLVACYGLQLQGKTDMGDIVAGGANFPTPVWENDKAWHDRIFVLTKSGGEFTSRTPRRMG